MRKLILVLACAIIAGSTIANADEKLVDLVKKVKPGVVLIETFDKDNKPIARGSGFFIDNKGSLITNHHVIEGAYSATIKTSTGKEYPVQGIVAKDTEADIVKLVVNLPDANITFLNLSVNVPSEGEDIFVIGNPLGLESTVSSGIVSAVRDIPAFGKIIQITAPVSPGSSGSPVINSKGEVIGIATLVAKEGQNLNFAIPSDKIIALKETAKATFSESYASLTADANDAQSFYDKGLKELWQEDWSVALTYFQKATAKNPQHANAWLATGCCYAKLGRYQDEIKAYKQAIRIKPDFAEAFNLLGITYGLLGRYEEAIVALKQAIKLNRTNTYYCLGLAYDGLSRHQEAIEAYKQALRIKPDDAEVYNQLGIAYGGLGRYQEEIEAYKEAIRIKPDYAYAHLNLGFTYHKLGRHQEAIEAFKRAVKFEPENAEVHLSLGLAYGTLGRWQEAIETFKQAIRIKPDYANAHYNLGNAYDELGRWQEAINAYKQAIRIKPDYAEVHYDLGIAYFNLGRYQEAIEAFKQAIRIKQDYANAHYNLGVTFLATGDKGSALEEYKILKTLDVERATKLFNLINQKLRSK